MRVLPSFILLLTGAMLIAGCSGDSADELHAKGKQAFAERDYAGARDYYLQAINQETTDRELLLDCAQAYRQDYRLDSAMYYLKRADLIHPKDREINEQVREVGIALGDWQNAINAIEVLADLDGTHEPYYDQLAELWQKNGHDGRAFYWARRALTLSPNNPALYMQTASWAARFDSMSVAIDLLDSAIAKFGPQDDILINKALFLAYSGQLRRAEAIMRPLAERDSIPNPSLQLNLARILERYPERPKKEEALQIYQSIREILLGRFPVDSLIQMLQNELE